MKTIKKKETEMFKMSLVKNTRNASYHSPTKSKKYMQVFKQRLLICPGDSKSNASLFFGLCLKQKSVKLKYTSHLVDGKRPANQL